MNHTHRRDLLFVVCVCVYELPQQPPSTIWDVSLIQRSRPSLVETCQSGRSWSQQLSHSWFQRRAVEWERHTAAVSKELNLLWKLDTDHFIYWFVWVIQKMLFFTLHNSFYIIILLRTKNDKVYCIIMKYYYHLTSNINEKRDNILFTIHFNESIHCLGLDCSHYMCFIKLCSAMQMRLWH